MFETYRTSPWNSYFCLITVWIVALMYARLLRRTHSYYLRPRSIGPSRISHVRAIHKDKINDILLQYEEELNLLHHSPDLVNKLEDIVGKHPELVTQLDLYRKLYPFPLDNFQVQSLQSLISGSNALVMTPTGSGKTVVSELAIYFSLLMGLRVAYTTPLKALSNQKFLDFRSKFGAERVGLLTGDLSINRDAPITIMTTEIFRNMIYNQDYSKSLSNLFMVCFDEFHYMNDPNRGTIWEESVISCPSSVRILALSATMGNVEDLGNWMSAIHGPTTLIKSDHRPVPLRYFFSTINGLSPLFSDPNAGPGSLNGVTRDIHGKVLDTCHLHPSIVRSEKHLQEMLSQYKNSGNRKQQYFKGQKNNNKVKHLFPRYSDVAKELLKKDKLPAIFFIFSRAGCEEAAEEVLKRNLDLISKADEHFIDTVLKDFMATNPTIPVSRQSIRLLQAGIGVHHAGLIPIWKSLIENLFNANKIKILFATETLAAGVNMPARTTVITSSSKRADSKTVKLKTSQMLQMAGRAGRRGKDVEGSVVIMQNQHEEATIPYRILISSIDGIKSHFRTSYSLTASLLNRKSLNECRSLIERGFGAFLLQQRLDRRKRNDEIENNHRAILQKYGLQEVEEYRQFLEKSDEEGKKLATIIKDVKKEEQDMLEEIIDYVPDGSTVRLRNGMQGFFLGKFIWVPFSDFLEEDPELSNSRNGYFKPYGPDESEIPGESGRFGVLTRDNLLYIVDLEHILAFDTDSPELDQAAVASVKAALLDLSEWEECKVILPALAEVGKNADTDAQHSSCPVLVKTMTKSQSDNIVVKVDNNPNLENVTKNFQEILSDNPRIASQIQKIKEMRNKIQQCAISLNNDTDAVLNAFQYMAFHNISDLQRFMKLPSPVKEEAGKLASKPTTLASNANNDSSKDLFAWKMFLSTADTLQSFYACYLDDGDVKLLPLGETIAAIAHDNELWMALILQHPAIAGTAHAQYMQSLTRAKLGPILARRQAKKNEIVSSFPIARSAESSKIEIDEESCCLSHEAFIFNIFNEVLEWRKPNERVKNKNYWHERRKEERERRLNEILRNTSVEEEEEDADIREDSEEQEEVDDDEEEVDENDEEEEEEDESIIDDITDDERETSNSSSNMEDVNGTSVKPWEIKDPYEFAGIVAATMFENTRGQDKGTIFKRAVPRNIDRFAYEVEDILMRLQSKQMQASSEHTNSHLTEYPISFSAEIGGLVAYWAKGHCTWRDLCRLTTLDQGDLCRILRRTVEFLRQIPETPHMSDKVLLMAWKAIGALDRFPVTDVDPVLLQEQQHFQEEQAPEENNEDEAVRVMKEKKKATKGKAKRKFKKNK